MSTSPRRTVAMIKKPLLYGCRESIIEEHGRPFVGLTSKLEDVQKIDPEPQKSWSWLKSPRFRSRRNRAESVDPETTALQPMQSYEDDVRADDDNGPDSQSQTPLLIPRKPVPTVTRLD